MGKHLQKQYPFRADESLIKKIDYIADFNTRNRNQQIEHLIKECIFDFESKNGQLIIEDDGKITLAKPQIIKEGKSSQSKIG